MALKSKAMNEVRANLVAVPVPAEEVVKFNLNIPKSLRTHWKDVANKMDTTVTDLIIEAMTKYPKA